jgi:co-chaperonin GroES (HSP10)
MLFEDAEIGENGDTSGLTPYGRTVVIKTDTLARMSSGDTGLIMIDSVQEKRNIGATTGIIVAMGSEAFTRHENMTPWSGDRPKVGDRVHFVVYAGAWTGGRDGGCYRLVDQNSVLAGEAPWTAVGDVQ